MDTLDVAFACAALIAVACLAVLVGLHMRTSRPFPRIEWDEVADDGVDEAVRLA